MEIITGRTEEPHILSEDEGALYAGIVGRGQYVLQLDTAPFSLQFMPQNFMRLHGGSLLMNGRLGRIRRGEYDELQYANGAAGYKRKDLLVIRYENTNGIESMTPVVITGEPVADPGEPTAPSYNEGDIYNGDTLVDFPLYSWTVSTDIHPATSIKKEFTVTEPIINFMIDKTVQDLYDAEIGEE